MSAGVLIQILFNLVFLATIIALWVRVHKPVKDDPRLSRGLQLLQNKISVLEDLADRTDTQVTQLTALIESKGKELQEKMIEADHTLIKIDKSIKKSLEVTEIFQDKIPHQEIIERQNTIKYVKAAKMAYDGATAAEIAREVDLTEGEIEMIVQVNKDQLMFAEESLPAWAQDEKQSEVGNEFKFEQHLLKEAPLNLNALMDQPSEAQEALKKLGQKFQAAQSEFIEKANSGMASEAVSSTQNISMNLSTDPGQTIVQNGKTLQVKPFQFKKIDLDSALG